MSAPLVVNTRDGICWTRRTVTSHDLNRAYATSERLAKQAARDTAITTAALLMLLTASEATR